jgi:putative ABC transport system permease protein
MRDFFYYLLQDTVATLQKLKNRWVHTLLSVIGIMVGVISIIILLSVSEGIREQTLQNIQDFGLNTIRVKIGQTKDDFDSIERIIGDNGLVSPIIEYPKESINFASSDFVADIYTSNALFTTVENLKIKRGRGVIPYDIERYNRVAVVSSDLSKKYHIEIGDFLRVKKMLLQVVGISSIHSKMATFIQIPISLFDTKKHKVDEIAIFIKNKESIFSFASLIESRMLENHQNIRDFKIIIPLKIIEKSRETYRLFSTITLIIALMSLLTGGVSVMNVMLSNISEQTREIGLRSALGATPKRIVQYYLIYAILMTFFGGVLGIIIGYIALWIIVVNSSIGVLFSLKAIVVALFISVFSGVIFGLYPAFRASRIEPMVALREF